MVRSDDSQALYEGSDIAADGRITQRVAFRADGYRFQIQGDPHLKADHANFLDLNVVDPQGRKASFAAWRGAGRRARACALLPQGLA